jgi:hypothetical protein
MNQNSTYFDALKSTIKQVPITLNLVLTSCWMTSSHKWRRVPLPLSSCLSYIDFVIRFWYTTRFAWNLHQFEINQKVTIENIRVHQWITICCMVHLREVDLCTISNQTRENSNHNLEVSLGHLKRTNESYL